MSKPSPARYRTTNWSGYNASLRKRGSLLIWVDKDMTWRAPRGGRPGRPPVFSDAAIQFVSASPSPMVLLLDYLPKFQGMRLSMSLCMC